MPLGLFSREMRLGYFADHLWFREFSGSLDHHGSNTAQQGPTMDFNGMDTSALAPMELYDSIFWGMFGLIFLCNHFMRSTGPLPLHGLGIKLVEPLCRCSY